MSNYNIPGVKTFPYTKIIGLDNITFGTNIIIDDFTFIYAVKRVRIGSYAHIACFSSITGGERFDMGELSSLSQGVRILTGTDDFEGWGLGNPTVDEKYRNVKRAPINIGRFCIVGANSVILPGVTIGEGAMVGACSVVTRDLKPWSVYIDNMKVRERDKKTVLNNYEKFLSKSKR
jgi:galactoside O-acetyltransferase